MSFMGPPESKEAFNRQDDRIRFYRQDATAGRQDRFPDQNQCAVLTILVSANILMHPYMDVKGENLFFQF